MLGQLYQFWTLIRRGRSEPLVITSIIEAEGGDVLEFRQLGRIQRTPFRGLRVYPIIYQFRVHYGHRHGSWLVRTSEGVAFTGESAGIESAWVDSDGQQDLPVVRVDASVANDANPIGWWDEAILVLGVIGVGLFTFYWYWS